MRRCWCGVLVALLGLVTSCTNEQSTPIDLGTTTSTSPPVTDVPEDDPNEDARNQVVELAKEECRKDPTAEFGIVVIADEDGVEVNRFEYPCADLETDGSDVDASGDE